MNLDTLPSLPLSERGSLPNCSAVYFVRDDSKLLYIGSAGSLVRRWMRHDKCAQFLKCTKPIISWLETEARDLLEREGALIQELRPLLNKSVPTPINVVKVRKVGGALIVTIPQSISKSLSIETGDWVAFSLVESDAMLLKPKKPRPIIAVEPVKPKGKSK